MQLREEAPCAVLANDPWISADAGPDPGGSRPVFGKLEVVQYQAAETNT